MISLNSRFLIFAGFFFLTTPLFATPWGKDADLASGQIHQKTTCNQVSPLTNWGISAIRFHQEVISPADGPRSHFIPSSSQYTLEAMQKYGFFKGYLLGCDRLMRENPEEWVYKHIRDGSGRIMKWDPVP